MDFFPGALSLPPIGRPNFFTGTDLDGSKRAVFLAHARPFRMSRTAFLLMPSRGHILEALRPLPLSMYIFNTSASVILALGSLGDPGTWRFVQ